MAGNTAVRVLDRPDASAMGEMVNAELANQIATAKKYPRDEDASLRLLEKLATKSDAVAEQCMYTLKRKAKNKDTGKEEIVFITGPSIHFMQLLNYCWGNMRAAARIVEEGPKTVTAQGLAYDLQRNNGLLVEIKRGITTSTGHRFGQDMINVTSNAACSIAERNAIEDCIPRVLWWDIYEAVKHKAVGAAQIPERIQQAVKFFVAKGATEADILTAMDVKAIADMGREHLEIFIGLRTALKEGTIDAAKIFTAEGEQQRQRLSLTDDGDADDGSGDSYNSIDKQLAPKENAAPQKPEEGGGKSSGDSGQAGESGKARGKGKGTKAEAGSAGEAAATPKDDGSPTHTLDGSAGSPEGSGPAASDSATDPTDAGQEQADADAEDAALLASLEARLDPSKAMSSRRAVNDARGALNRISTLGSDANRARAEKILKDWPAK